MKHLLALNCPPVAYLKGGLWNSGNTTVKSIFVAKAVRDSSRRLYEGILGGLVAP
jgi:hypothetical protein